MRLGSRSLLLFAGLSLAAPALAQSAPAPAPAATDPGAIVVRGKREREAQIRTFIDQLAPGRFNKRLVRFSADVCPGALGFEAAQGKAIAARLRDVGRAVGVPLAKPGCKPNLWVVLTDDRDALAEKIRGAWENGLGKRPERGAKTDFATVLHQEGEVDANGQQLGAKKDIGDGDGGYYQSEIYTSDRIRPQASRTFTASAMLVEPKAVTGLTALQLADYAAMRLFARADPARLGPDSPGSILSALAAPMGSEVPQSVTEWDVAFLKALYRSNIRSYAGRQKQEMQGIVRKEITGQDQAPKPRR